MFRTVVKIPGCLIDLNGKIVPIKAGNRDEVQYRIPAKRAKFANLFD